MGAGYKAAFPGGQGTRSRQGRPGVSGGLRITVKSNTAVRSPDSTAPGPAGSRCHPSRHSQGRERIVEALNPHLVGDQHVVDLAAGGFRHAPDPGRSTACQPGLATNSAGLLVTSDWMNTLSEPDDRTIRGVARRMAERLDREQSGRDVLAPFVGRHLLLQAGLEDAAGVLEHALHAVRWSARLISPSSMKIFPLGRRHQHFGIRETPACCRRSAGR